jgi:hypothetical protein
MSELVNRLSQGTHPIEISLRPERTMKAFKEAVDRGYVHIKFTNTHGGTELGVRVTDRGIDLDQANFDAETGRVKLSGELRLDYVKVKCVADVELPSMQGEGHLEVISEPSGG